MKRLFMERSRLVVYVEASDLTRLTEKARSEGKTVVEWARETLLGELEDSSGLPRTPAVRVAERRTLPVELDAVAAEGPRGKVTVEKSKERTCKHGVAKSWHCWQCGGIAVIE